MVVAETDERRVGSLTTECKFCGHYYIQPCDAKKAKACRNVRKKKGNG